MPVVLLTNPNSGRGLSKRLRTRFLAALHASGIETQAFDVDRAYPQGLPDGALADADALAIIGGDGTMHHAAPAAAANNVPVYHVPAGNENLFAREFGMTRDTQTFVAALRAHRTQAVDLGIWHTRPFLIMASTGVDAGVIRRLDSVRSKAFGHFSYVGPVLAEAARPSISTLTVDVDGRRLVNARRGWLVIGTSRHYAMGINIARAARVSDGLLHVVFMPHDTVRGAIRWAARARLGVPYASVGGIEARGAHVAVLTEHGDPWQLDGEYAGHDAPRAVSVSIQPASLRVLLPESYTMSPPTIVRSTDPAPNECPSSRSSE